MTAEGTEQTWQTNRRRSMLEQYRLMLLIRCFEERAVELLTLPGAVEITAAVRSLQAT